MGKVVVVGSLNMDIVMKIKEMPSTGETVLAKETNYLYGGKGANQAVAAARMGAEVKMVGAVGNDAFGTKLVAQLEKEAIDTSGIIEKQDVPSGMAAVFKLPADNAIVVADGANGKITVEDIKKYKELIQEADCLLVQLETPIAAVKKALQLAKEADVYTILNPAPFSEEAEELLAYADLITPNETEFAQLLGCSEIEDSELEQKMIKWTEQYDSQLVLTLGKEGVAYIEQGKLVKIPSRQVKAEDTTGAGDTFNGILAQMLSEKAALREAIQIANIGASIAVQKVGAQTGMPTAEEVLEVKNK